MIETTSNIFNRPTGFRDVDIPLVLQLTELCKESMTYCCEDAAVKCAVPFIVMDRQHALNHINTYVYWCQCSHIKSYVVIEDRYPVQNPYLYEILEGIESIPDTFILKTKVHNIPSNPHIASLLTKFTDIIIEVERPVTEDGLTLQLTTRGSVIPGEKLTYFTSSVHDQLDGLFEVLALVEYKTKVTLLYTYIPGLSMREVRRLFQIYGGHAIILIGSDDTVEFVHFTGQIPVIIPEPEYAVGINGIGPSDRIVIKPNNAAFKLHYNVRYDDDPSTRYYPNMIPITEFLTVGQLFDTLGKLRSVNMVRCEGWPD